jgi:hypothetical protein
LKSEQKNMNQKKWYEKYCYDETQIFMKDFSALLMKVCACVNQDFFITLFVAAK